MSLLKLKSISIKQNKKTIKSRKYFYIVLTIFLLKVVFISQTTKKHIDLRTPMCFANLRDKYEQNLNPFQ